MHLKTCVSASEDRAKIVISHIYHFRDSQVIPVIPQRVILILLSKKFFEENITIIILVKMDLIKIKLNKSDSEHNC